MHKTSTNHPTPIPKSSPNRAKKHTQTIQNPSPKSTQNDPQTDPGGTWNRTWHLLDASWKAEHQPTGVHRPVAKTGLPRVSYAPKSGVTTPSGLRRFFSSAKMSPFVKMLAFCGKKSPKLPQGSLWRTLGSPGSLLATLGLLLWASPAPLGLPWAPPGAGLG